MNPLRALGDWLAANFDHPYTGEGPGDLSEHERLMRHTGRPECPIPDHADALRQLGRAIMERDEARALADLWMRRTLTAEAKLRHPCTGQADTPAA